MRRSRFAFIALTVLCALQAFAPCASAQEKKPAGDIVRVTLGFEQVGAAGTNNTQKYSFEFFTSRPLPVWEGCDSGALGERLRWWGDVRVGSYPQQINSDVATFAKDFAKNIGGVPVNKLAQTAEFMTGPEFKIASTREPDYRQSITSGERQQFALMGFLGIGSIGPFAPGDDPAVLAVPTDTQSPQYKAFQLAYPGVSSKYVAFVPQDRHEFSFQWGVGLRLYTIFTSEDKDNPLLRQAPATVEVSFGQNDFVAPRDGNGHRPPVWHAAAYYPFALGDRKNPSTLVIYFYGDANMRLGHANVSAPLFLAPAVDDKNVAIPLSNQDVSIVPVPPNRRDTYRIGVSVDLYRVWNKLTQ